MTDLSIRAADGGSFAAYLAIPKSGPKSAAQDSPNNGRAAGVVIIQEIFGINPWMRAVADGFAEFGYVALVPDLYWRMKPGVALDADNEDEFKKGVGYMQRLDEAKAIEDLKAAVAALRAHPSCNGKVGSVGYCLGGRLAFLLACRSDTDCNVGYYGVNLPAVLGEAGGITKPLLLHIAEKDKFVPPPAQAQIKEALSGNPLVTLHSYPDADHGFARSGSHAYNAAPAKLANGRTAEFLRRHLAG